MDNHPHNGAAGSNGVEFVHVKSKRVVPKRPREDPVRHIEILHTADEPEKLFPYGDHVPPSPTGRWSNIVYHLLKTKPFSVMGIQEHRSNLRRSLGAFDLTMITIGELIGAGVMILTGQIAANNAGPAVVLSFAIATVVAFLAGLCYCELASFIHLTGSSFTYSYMSLGEVIAWMIGWDMCLEYLAVAAVVSVGWSSYFQAFFHDFGWDFDPRFMGPPLRLDPTQLHMESSDAFMNLPAMAIGTFLTILLVLGTKESAAFNAIAVFVKLTIIILFIWVMAGKCDQANWQPFIPPNQGGFGRFGLSGVFEGATTCFFCFIGFDSVTVCAQECRNPQRDVPIGMLAGLTVSALMYMGVSVVATGVLPYTAYKGISSPISYAVHHFPGHRWLSITINIGAICGMTSVILVSLLAQPRIFYAMAADGLLPPAITRVHPRFKTPHYATLISGTLCVLLAGLLPMEVLAELTSVGTLFAFSLTCLGVLVLRYKEPDRYRPFRVPGGRLIPLLGSGSCLLLICSASRATIFRLFAWMAIGLVFYGCYGYRKSRLRQKIRVPGLDDEEAVKRKEEEEEELKDESRITSHDHDLMIMGSRPSTLMGPRVLNR